MKRRIFFGIALPPDIGKRLERKLAPFLELPVIWTHIDNRHIALQFIGWVDDEKLPEITEQAKEVCEGIEPFDVSTSRIVMAPSSNPDRIEATGEGNDDLRDLANRIGSVFDEYAPERKLFYPHITLGRIRRSQWRALPSAPIIDIPAHFSIPVTEVTLFESTTIDGKRRYIPIETIDLEG